jgi:hypothetical protein
MVSLDDGRTVWVKEDRTWGIWGSKKADGRKVTFDAVGLEEEPEPGVFRPSDAKYRLQDMDMERHLAGREAHRGLLRSPPSGPLGFAANRQRVTSVDENRS